MKYLFMAGIIASSIHANAQKPLSPEKLWELGRVSGQAITPDGTNVIYNVTKFNLQDNSGEGNLYMVPVNGGVAQQITFSKGSESVVDFKSDGKELIYLHGGQLWKLDLETRESVQITNYENALQNVKFSPDGKYIAFTQSVLVKPFHSKDKYEDLSKSNVYVYDQLHYRHWDTFSDGKYKHVFVAEFKDGKIFNPIDLLENEPYHTPQSPFGGGEDYVWSPDSKSLIYVSKKKFGTEYAVSTNTDIYQYDINSKQTVNLTSDNLGYDTHPEFSPKGSYLTWLRMEEDGYEADKNDIIIQNQKDKSLVNLTALWDGTVNSFSWSADEKILFFTAPIKGTIQLFQIDIANALKNKNAHAIKQISQGEHDINSILGQTGNSLVVGVNTINRANELHVYDLKKNTLSPITHVNDQEYQNISKSEVKSRITKATDGKDLFSWIVYPPNFDPNKKYPTLLYCQGGPQSALTQFYSFRWNLQLIAAQGYIVVAPNRRGMPGHGVEWNEQISGDWGGQVIQDYLSAIDDMAKEPYVDSERLGAIGASFGGYSVFMLAGVHENRFKTFISHCGLFDMTSWYGTTEELFFANKDLGGAYWESKENKSYTEFNPSTYVNNWNTPILIIQGGKDYRVPIGQGLQAFQAAQLKGIKSRLMYLPDENHWVNSAQNALVWQREFFKWLEETL